MKVMTKARATPTRGSPAVFFFLSRARGSCRCHIWQLHRITYKLRHFSAAPTVYVVSLSEKFTQPWSELWACSAWVRKKKAKFTELDCFAGLCIILYTMKSSRRCSRACENSTSMKFLWDSRCMNVFILTLPLEFYMYIVELCAFERVGYRDFSTTWRLQCEILMSTCT